MSDEDSTEGTPHEQMTQYDDLAEQERTARRAKSSVVESVGRDIAAAVEDAAAETGVGVEVTSTSTDGRHQTLRARLDRASLVAAVTESLPDGFVVEHVNDDGTLTVEWDERATVPDGRKHSAVLKAIVAEETVLDEDGLIESVPTKAAVLDRAVDLGIERGAATDRLDRLADLDVVDVTDDGVYPDTNFSKF